MARYLDSLPSLFPFLSFSLEPPSHPRPSQAPMAARGSLTSASSIVASPASLGGGSSSSPLLGGSSRQATEELDSGIQALIHYHRVAEAAALANAASATGSGGGGGGATWPLSLGSTTGFGNGNGSGSGAAVSPPPLALGGAPSHPLRSPHQPLSSTATATASSVAASFVAANGGASRAPNPMVSVGNVFADASLSSSLGGVRSGSAVAVAVANHRDREHPHPSHGPSPSPSPRWTQEEYAPRPAVGPAALPPLPPPLDLVPPYRFALVEEGLYRGAYPVLRNFPFLQTLRLRTIVQLTPEEPTFDLSRFAFAHGIKILHIQAERFKGEAQLLPEDFGTALQTLINADKQPVYLHCLDGRQVTGLVVMALRKLQHWDIAANHAEYCRYAKGVEDEVAFITDYNGPIEVPPRIPKWLWDGSWADANGSPRPRLHPQVKLRFPALPPPAPTTTTAAATAAAAAPAAAGNASLSVAALAQADTARVVALSPVPSRLPKGGGGGGGVAAGPGTPPDALRPAVIPGVAVAAVSSSAGGQPTTMAGGSHTSPPFGVASAPAATAGPVVAADADADADATPPLSNPLYIDVGDTAPLPPRTSGRQRGPTRAGGSGLVDQESNSSAKGSGNTSHVNSACVSAVVGAPSASTEQSRGGSAGGGGPGSLAAHNGSRANDFPDSFSGPQSCANAFVYGSNLLYPNSNSGAPTPHAGHGHTSFPHLSTLSTLASVTAADGGPSSPTAAQQLSYAPGGEVGSRKTKRRASL